jgi:hypothetical protein
MTAQTSPSTAYSKPMPSPSPRHRMHRAAYAQARPADIHPSSDMPRSAHDQTSPCRDDHEFSRCTDITCPPNLQHMLRPCPFQPNPGRAQPTTCLYQLKQSPDNGQSRPFPDQRMPNSTQAKIMPCTVQHILSPDRTQNSLCPPHVQAVPSPCTDHSHLRSCPAQPSS